jgi:hypothetical protein
MRIALSWVESKLKCGNGYQYSYARKPIEIGSLPVGLVFSDNTNLKKWYASGRKYTDPFSSAEKAMAAVDALLIEEGWKLVDSKFALLK